MTFLRGAVEQAHAALFHCYKGLRNLHHSSFRSVGRRVIETAARRSVTELLICYGAVTVLCRFGVDPQWALEQYEMSEAYLDYLGAVQLYNKYHAKFRRRLPAWLQVLSSALLLCALSSVVAEFTLFGVHLALCLLFYKVTVMQR